MTEVSRKIFALKNIGEFRETGTNFSKFNIPELQLRAGSQDPRVAAAARRELDRVWNPQSEFTSEAAETVNLLESMKEYSPQERRKIASHLAALQLTQGCNGRCPFCFYGEKRGVTAKFSFDSIVQFLTKYQDHLPPALPLYQDSDPFDYQDGEFNFSDVFKAWRKIKPGDFQSVSTTVPKGSQEHFVDFMVFAAREYATGRESAITLKVRLSIGRHNIQRIEAVLEKLVSTLAAKGMGEAEIEDFFGKCLSFGDRVSSDKVFNLGPFIDRGDDIRSIFTPACKDGAVLTPEGAKGVMITAPTIYEPSGQKDVALEPGKVINQTPSYTRIEHYAEFNEFQSLLFRTEHRQTMLPAAHDLAGNLLELSNPAESITNQLGREVAAIGSLMLDFANLYHQNVLCHSYQKRMEYLQVAAEVYSERAEFTRERVAQAKRLTEQSELSEEEVEKIEYYILLTETYLAEMDFLVNQIKEGQSVSIVNTISAVFRQVGRGQVQHLPEIIEGIASVGESVEKREITSYKKIEQTVIEKIGEPFDVDIANPNSIPEWIKNLSEAYYLSVCEF